MKSAKRQKGKGGKIAVSIICILMSLVIVLLCLQVFGKGRVKPSKWFKGETPSVSETIGGGMVLPDHNEPDEEQGVSRIALRSLAIPAVSFAEYGISEQAESAYTVTATVEPDNEATNTAIKWEIAWKDSSSAWASGKTVTDYVTATPAGESFSESKIVTVECLKSFGEPIILTAKCQYDETITATVQIDYAQRLTMTEYVATNLTDAMGTRYSITWGGETAMPFEFGNTAQVVDLFPASISLKPVGDFTLEETYFVSLTHEQVTGMDVGGYTYNFETQTSDLGQVVISKELNGEAFVLRPNHSNGQNEPYNMSAVHGIGKSLVGFWKGNENYKQILSEACENNASSKYSDLNSRLDSLHSVNNKFHFSDLVLKVEGSRFTYEFQTEIILTKALYNATLSGVTLDQTTIVM